MTIRETNCIFRVRRSPSFFFYLSPDNGKYAFRRADASRGETRAMSEPTPLDSTWRISPPFSSRLVSSRLVSLSPFYPLLFLSLSRPLYLNLSMSPYSPSRPSNSVAECRRSQTHLYAVNKCSPLSLASENRYILRFPERVANSRHAFNVNLRGLSSSARLFRSSHEKKRPSRGTYILPSLVSRE